MQSNIKIKSKFKCIIGLLNFERKKKQKIIIKIKAKSDDFLDYAKLEKKVKKIYKKNKFFTIEDSLEFTSKELKNKFENLKYIKISVFKPNIIRNAKVGASVKKYY